MGIAERKEREKEQRRNDIIDAAENVFFSKGINLATMDEVAEKAELSKGTLYLYFKSKGDLYLAITQRALSLLADMFDEAIKKYNTGLDQIRAVGQAYYSYSQIHANYFNTILHYEISQLEMDGVGETILECHRLGQKVMLLVSSTIETGIKDGTIRADLDPVKTAYLLQGQSSGIIQLIARESEHIKSMEIFEPQELMTDFTDMMYHALKADNSNI
jgi:AcrR family transcriptional regulator